MKALSDFRHVVKVACVYLSGVIGAGFVTGREVYVYFGKFGANGYIGIAVASVLFILTAVRLLAVIEKYDCRSMSDVTEAMFGRRAGKFVCMANALFLYCMYIVISAGAGELICSLTGTRRVTSMLAVSGVCIFFLFIGFGGIAAVCSVAAPITAVIMLAAVILPGKAESGTAGPVAASEGGFLWAVMAAVYVGYNVLVLISVMPRIKNDIKNQKTARLGGASGAIMVSCLLFAVNYGMNMTAGIGGDSDMPLAEAAAGRGEVFGAIMYGAVLVTMILSASANISNCGELIGRHINIKERTAGTVLAAVGGLFSLAGFGPLMDIFYTFFGFLGVILIFPLVFTKK